MRRGTCPHHRARRNGLENPSREPEVDEGEKAALTCTEGLSPFVRNLAHAGRDICAEPVEDRKQRLQELIAGLSDSRLQNTGGIAGEGRALFETIRARGMEGMEGMVAKRLGSRYVPGQRTGAWIKVKVPG